MKKAFAFLLIFSTISLLFGQDLNDQINMINEQYDTNIQENSKNAINSFFGFDIFETLGQIFSEIEIVKRD